MDYVDYCYNFLLNRAPDPAGKVFYETYLKENPNITPFEFANLFIASPEFGAKHPRQASKIMGGATVHAINGEDIFVRDGDWVYHDACTSGQYEPHVAGLISKLLPAGGYFLDLGANIGVHSAVASRAVGPHGFVYAFDASVDNVSLIKRSSAEFGRSNIVAMAIALSDSRSVTHLSMNDSGSNQFLTDSGDPVLTSRVDDLLPDDLSRLDLIKMDVEGQEGRVITGARNILERFRPPIIAEFHLQSGQMWYVSEILSHGYSVSLIHLDGATGAEHPTLESLLVEIPRTGDVHDILFRRTNP